MTSLNICFLSSSFSPCDQLEQSFMLEFRCHSVLAPGSELKLNRLVQRSMKNKQCLMPVDFKMIFQLNAWAIVG